MNKRKLQDEDTGDEDEKSPSKKQRIGLDEDESEPRPLLPPPYRPPPPVPPPAPAPRPAAAPVPPPPIPPPRPPPVEDEKRPLTAAEIRARLMRANPERYAPAPLPLYVPPPPPPPRPAEAKVLSPAERKRLEIEQEIKQITEELHAIGQDTEFDQIPDDKKKLVRKELNKYVVRKFMMKVTPQCLIQKYYRNLDKLSACLLYYMKNTKGWPIVPHNFMFTVPFLMAISDEKEQGRLYRSFIGPAAEAYHNMPPFDHLNYTKEEKIASFREFFTDIAAFAVQNYKNVPEETKAELRKCMPMPGNDPSFRNMLKYSEAYMDMMPLLGKDGSYVSKEYRTCYDGDGICYYYENGKIVSFPMIELKSCRDVNNDPTGKRKPWTSDMERQCKDQKNCEVRFSAQQNTNQCVDKRIVRKKLGSKGAYFLSVPIFGIKSNDEVLTIYQFVYKSDIMWNYTVSVVRELLWNGRDDPTPTGKVMIMFMPYNGEELGAIGQIELGINMLLKGSIGNVTVTYKNKEHTIGIQLAFYSKIKSIMELVFDALSEQGIRNPECIVVGHSLGGMMANIATFIIAAEIRKRVTMYAHGAPRAGDERLFNFMNRLQRDGRISADSINTARMMYLYEDNNDEIFRRRIFLAVRSHVDPVVKSPAKTAGTIYSYLFGRSYDFHDNFNLRIADSGFMFFPHMGTFEYQDDYLQILYVRYAYPFTTQIFTDIYQYVKKLLWGNDKKLPKINENVLSFWDDAGTGFFQRVHTDYLLHHVLLQREMNNIPFSITSLSRDGNKHTRNVNLSRNSALRALFQLYDDSYFSENQQLFVRTPTSWIPRPPAYLFNSD